MYLIQSDDIDALKQKLISGKNEKVHGLQNYADAQFYGKINDKYGFIDVLYLILLFFSSIHFRKFNKGTIQWRVQKKD